jgi:hypothetical protein
MNAKDLKMLGALIGEKLPSSQTAAQGPLPE